MERMDRWIVDVSNDWTGGMSSPINCWKRGRNIPSPATPFFVDLPPYLIYHVIATIERIVLSVVPSSATVK
jgi:hypothetical protein